MARLPRRLKGAAAGGAEGDCDAAVFCRVVDDLFLLAAGLLLVKEQFIVLFLYKLRFLQPGGKCLVFSPGESQEIDYRGCARGPDLDLKSDFRFQDLHIKDLCLLQCQAARVLPDTTDAVPPGFELTVDCELSLILVTCSYMSLLR